MKSSAPGKSISATKVGATSSRGFWLHLGEVRHFLAFTRYPWFRGAPRAALANVTRPSRDHLYWPALDVDLSVESLVHPERFPLRSKLAAQPSPRARVAKS
jgi:hypothetical protein